MARIAIPAGEGSELDRVWTLSPELGAAVGGLAGKVGGRLTLPWRVREAARMRIAQINGCNI
jgi:alkylhydroperoxidase family enzyme